MNNLISIIMPVYNSSEYLKQSIQSVIDQKHELWELICIDDGSTDNSLDILEDYKNIDKRIKVFSQKNAGPAQARRVGIYHSIGEYVAYLDSDDTYSNDYMSETLKQAIATDADVVMPILVAGWTSEKEYNFNDRNSLKYGDELLPKNAFLRTFPWSVHGLCLYRAQHIKKYALTEISNVNNFNADEYLTRHLFLFANNIVVSNGIYFYRHNSDSLTKEFSLRHLGAVEVNLLLFKLAMSEGFSKIELKKIANEIMISNSSLKYKLLNNQAIFKEDDFNCSFEKLKADSEWHDFLKIDSMRLLVYYIFLRLNIKPSIFSIKLYNRFL